MPSDLFFTQMSSELYYVAEELPPTATLQERVETLEKIVTAQASELESMRALLCELEPVLREHKKKKRLEKKKLEKERLEKLEKERSEKKKMEKELLLLETERFEKMRLEAERLEKERLLLETELDRCKSKLTIHTRLGNGHWIDQYKKRIAEIEKEINQ